jgi:chromosome segregation ATPase
VLRAQVKECLEALREANRTLDASRDRRTDLEARIEHPMLSRGEKERLATELATLEQQICREWDGVVLAMDAYDAKVAKLDWTLNQPK